DISSAPSPVADSRATPPPLLLSIVVWSIPAIFYLFAFFLRSSPAVMTAELMRDFGIGAKDLGSLSAFYFYAYVLMQIPLGLLIGNIGALTAQVPLRLMVEHFNWRTVVSAAGAITLLVVVLAWTLVRNDPSSRGYLSYAPLRIQTQGKTSLAQVGAGFRRI